MQALDDDACTRGNGKFLLKCEILSLILYANLYSAKIMDSHLLRSLSKGSLESITTYNTWKCMTHRVILRRLDV